MIVELDMSTGRKIIEPGEEYGEEVLLANWLPRPEAGLALQQALPARRQCREDERDAEAFLRAIYLCQE